MHTRRTQWLQILFQCFSPSHVTVTCSRCHSPAPVSAKDQLWTRKYDQGRRSSLPSSTRFLCTGFKQMSFVAPISTSNHPSSYTRSITLGSSMSISIAFTPFLSQVATRFAFYLSMSHFIIASCATPIQHWTFATTFALFLLLLLVYLVRQFIGHLSKLN